MLVCLFRFSNFLGENGASFQITNYFYFNNCFSTKDKTPNFLKSFLVYKLVCARWNYCYIGETCRHFKTRIDEHVKKDKKSNIYKHLNNNEECFLSFNSGCFSILDYAPTQDVILVILAKPVVTLKVESVNM